MYYVLYLTIIIQQKMAIKHIFLIITVISLLISIVLKNNLGPTIVHSICNYLLMCLVMI